MAPAISDEAALNRLRKLYTDAFHIHHRPSDADVIRWAQSPFLWAEHEIRHRNKSYLMAEAVVRNCRILLKRATRAFYAFGGTLDAPAPGTEPFDPLMPSQPTACEGGCNVEV